LLENGVIFHSVGMSQSLPNESGELAAVDATMNLAAQTMPAGELGAAFAKMFLTLASLVVLLLLTYWFIRKFLQNRLQRGTLNSSIQILEKRMISTKTMLYLIRVDNKKILVAESHLEVQCLGESPMEVHTTCPE